MDISRIQILPWLPEVPLHARSGWAIPCEYKPPPLRETIERQTKLHKSWRRTIEIRSTSNHPYNCVGMIFGSRRAWIDIDHIYKLLQEDYYQPTPRSEINEGDLVLYTTDDNRPIHVALIIGVNTLHTTQNIWVLSKWGEVGEYVHAVEDVTDWMGKPTNYYTTRVT